MSRSTYVGRHRGRHRAEVQPRSASLPGAAAAALTLTGVGVAVVPGLSGAAAASDEPDTASQPTAGHGAAHAQTASLQDSAARATMLAEVREARDEAVERASRERQRERIAEKRRLALQRAHRYVMPVEHFRFSSNYGMRWGRLHAGDDFAAPIGTRVGALTSGTVVFAGVESGYGNKVEVRHWDGTVSWYAHLSRITVTVGEKVSPGEKIGEVGNTGHSTGPHLHLEIHPDGGGPVDPAGFLAKHGLKV